VLTGCSQHSKVTEMQKSERREQANRKARFAPRGHATDNRPAAVRENRGLVRKLARMGAMNGRTSR
jgi:hypothetical protein